MKIHRLTIAAAALIVVVTDGTIIYDIGELAPGEYFFDCSLHPDMTGTLIVEG